MNEKSCSKKCKYSDKCRNTYKRVEVEDIKVDMRSIYVTLKELKRMKRTEEIEEMIKMMNIVI